LSAQELDVSSNCRDDRGFVEELVVGISANEALTSVNGEEMLQATRSIQ
jgi:hypothetical protein